MNNSPLHIIRLLFNSAGKQQEKFQYYSEKALFYKIHGPIENSADCYHGIAGYYFISAIMTKRLSITCVPVMFINPLIRLVMQPRVLSSEYISPLGKP